MEKFQKRSKSRIQQTFQVEILKEFHFYWIMKVQCELMDDLLDVQERILNFNYWTIYFEIFFQVSAFQVSNKDMEYLYWKKNKTINFTNHLYVNSLVYIFFIYFFFFEKFISNIIKIYFKYFRFIAKNLYEYIISPLRIFCGKF